VPRRSFWGWGNEEDALAPAERDAVGQMLAARLGGEAPAPIAPPKIDEVTLGAPRFALPASLAHLGHVDARTRAGHAYGKAFRDVARGLARDFAAAPDVVAFPADEDDVRRLLDFCAEARVAAIPYGGGSSVVGGVEARLPASRGFAGALSIDLAKLAGVREVDVASRAARVGGGTLGPALEDALRPHGLTLRHFPQSFEFSTLGGWIATRAGGHFATLATHIDDSVEAVRVVTPTGLCATRRLPASGAGPSPERLFIGSEGALGVVTEAWVRLHERPRFRASATLRYVSFSAACRAARALAQSGLYPTNCRVLDAAEAQNAMQGDGSANLLLVAFESSDHALEPWIARALEIAKGEGAELEQGSYKVKDGGAGAREGAAGAWRQMFLRGPYLRDALVTLGYVVETFETAITWDRFDSFSAAVRERAERVAREVTGGEVVVACRVTHVYPDGAAPYFTVIGKGKGAASMAKQWDEIKAAVSEVIVAEGGTISHHHATGRDHMPGYEKERAEPFARALAAVKRELDPAGVMNPGVLV
jgi:alkyldihydroxyacetonephosphate synthase